jgi:hypothetical protein
MTLALLAAAGACAQQPSPAEAPPQPLSYAQEAALAGYGPAVQPPASPITDVFAIRAGYYWGHVGTTGRFDSAAGVPGTPFNLEYDFGLTPKQRQPRVELIFRLRERSRLRVDFFDLSRTSTQTLTRPIVYGNHTFFANDVVNSEFDWRQTDFTYTYSVVRNDRLELGLGVGLSLVQAEAIGDVPARAVREEFSGAGPFATLAADGTWRISERWALTARAQYFDLRVSGQHGASGDYRGELQYRPVRHLAVGLGFEGLRVGLDVRNKNPSGIVKLNVDGPELFLRASL